MISITNITEMRARNSLNNITQQLNESMKRLSTGLRINSAKDDPAGLQISNRMTSEIEGLRQAQRNAADGQALAQTAEGALDETTNILQRIRTLKIQYDSGVNSAEDKAAIQTEVDQLSQQLDSIATQTKFGGKTLLEGQTASSIYDATGMLTIQIGAHSGDTVSLDMNKSFTLAELDDRANTATGASALNVGGTIDMSKNTLIASIDSMLADVDSKRAELGAFQNRLDSSMRSQSNTIANLSDARSRIRDTDFAEESAKLAQNTIRQQAALMMMMNARNAHGSMILRLIGAQ